jgi:ribosome-associated translation inhibitor RaiA
MQVPVQVTFRDMPVSDAVEAACWDEAAKLGRYYDHITSCRIVLEAACRHHTVRQFEVRIELAVPGRVLVVNRHPPEDQRGEDIQSAVSDAFSKVRRQLEDFVQRQRGQVKSHESSSSPQTTAPPPP